VLCGEKEYVVFLILALALIVLLPRFRAAEGPGADRFVCQIGTYSLRRDLALYGVEMRLTNQQGSGEFPE
jgi:hypothetical protein